MELVEGDKKYCMELNPLTIILINFLMPLISTVFPTIEGIVINLFFVFIILIISKKFRLCFKYILSLIIFFLLYYVFLFYVRSPYIVSMFRATMVFIPCIALAALLISEYNSSELLSALQSLKLPKIFIIAMTVTLRYIATFKREFKIIKEAMKIRGVDFSVRHPLRTYEYLLVPLLFRCLNLSGEITAAGLTKGLDTPNDRSSFFMRRLSTFDYISFAFLILAHSLVIGEII